MVEIEKFLDLGALQTLSSELGRERWRALSDAAQVVASYLACHPRVEAVRYSGLKADPDFGRASCELVGGFGPRVAYRTSGAPAGEWELWEADGRDAREQVMELEGLLAGS
ncbi:hypothetical protein [Thermophilibacter sp.]